MDTFLHQLSTTAGTFNRTISLKHPQLRHCFHSNILITGPGDITSGTATLGILVHVHGAQTPPPRRTGVSLKQRQDKTHYGHRPGLGPRLFNEKRL